VKIDIGLTDSIIQLNNMMQRYSPTTTLAVCFDEINQFKI